MLNINEVFKVSKSMPVMSKKHIPNIPSLRMREAKSTNRGISALNFPLSEEEKEQKLNAVDNGVKMVGVSNWNKEAMPASEQVAVIRTQEELERFEEKLFNLPAAEVDYLVSVPLHSACAIAGEALYSIEPPESTPENPIIYVTVGRDGDPNSILTIFRVNVNQVNPHSATREEMFALITHQNRHDEEALIKASRAFGDLDPWGEYEGRTDYMKLIEAAFAWAEKDYKSGDMRAKDAYEALLSMVDKLGKHATRQTKSAAETSPAPTSIYHKYAAEKAKMKAEISPDGLQ